LAGKFDGSTVRFGDPLDDRKAQAEAAILARAGAIGAVEALENARRVLGAIPVPVSEIRT